MHANATRPRSPPDCTDTPAEPIRNMQDVLSNPCRRAILFYLQERDGPVALTAVARQLVAWERGTSMSGQRDAARVEQLRPRILQAHVLEMEQFGILQFDPDTDTVRIPDDVTISVAPPEGSPEHPDAEPDE